MFQTLHDDPPQWVAVLTAYLDESSGSGDGFHVIGGFLGNDEAWKRCGRAWKSKLCAYGRTTLHMKDLRLGSAQAPERHSAMLADFASIPASSGLFGIYGYVRTSEYEHSVENTVASLTMAGYPLSLWPAVTSILQFVPSNQRG